jgi:hypothetical protein
MLNQSYKRFILKEFCFERISHPSFPELKGIAIAQECAAANLQYDTHIRVRLIFLSISHILFTVSAAMSGDNIRIFSTLRFFYQDC